MSFGYGTKGDKQEMIALIRSTVDQGVTFFDTAEIYGPFTNEELGDEAFAPFRDQPRRGKAGRSTGTGDSDAGAG
jgi:aryl-alcohol dehydrogenase-like predicted oxidoreductase